MKRLLGAALGRDVEGEQPQEVAAREQLLVGIARLADARDDAGGGHIDRMMRYARILGEAVRTRTRRRTLTDEQIRWLELGAALHDIGKAAIPDSILLKPGLLTSPERLTMQEHTVIGARCLDQALTLSGPDGMLAMIREVIRSHHERWDGGGYPDQLEGTDIPLAARIVALADVYDALTRKRVYKLAMSHEQASRIICEGAGTQFDPAVVKAFESQMGLFVEVAMTVHHDVDPVSGTPFGELMGTELPDDPNAPLVFRPGSGA